MNEIIIKTIYKVLKKICQHEINWVIIGSAGTLLQGIQIAPKDIDILTDQIGFYWFRDNFDYHISKEFNYSNLENSRSFFGSLEINGIAIEIMADLKNKFNDDWELHQGLSHKKYMQFDSMELPVLSLFCEQYICEQLKRKDKAIQIENFIKSKMNYPVRLRRGNSFKSHISINFSEQGT